MTTVIAEEHSIFRSLSRNGWLSVFGVSTTVLSGTPDSFLLPLRATFHVSAQVNYPALRQAEVAGIEVLADRVELISSSSSP